MRIDRLARRREQLGPVNPLAEQEYEEAIAHVEELETQRGDLESALHELEGLIKETDRRIREAFEETFEQAARNFEEVVQQLFPGGRGRLRLVRPEGPKPVLGGEDPPTAEQQSDAADEAAEAEDEAPDKEEPGVEVEVTPAGKSMKKLSLLSGGEKSLVALAFMFAVFLARPCPFYILDEVEAALDDLEHRPLPAADPPVLRPGAVHHRHAPEADDGRRRRPLRREHGRQRHLEGRLAQAAAARAAARGGCGRRRSGCLRAFRNPSPMDLLIVFFGFAVGILIGLTGVGGGSLMTPLLLIAGGYSPVVTIGTDLAYGAITKTVGGWRHLRAGHVDLRLSWWLAAGSMPGSVLGVIAVNWLHDKYGDAFEPYLLAAVAVALGFASSATLYRALFRPGLVAKEREAAVLQRRISQVGDGR